MTPSRLGVRGYLVIGFGAVIGLFALASLLTILTLGRVEGLLDRLRRLDEVRHAGHLMLSAIQEQYIHQAHTLIERDRSHVEHYLEYRDEVDSRFRALTAACAEIGISAGADGGRRSVDEMHDLFMLEVVPKIESLPAARIREYHDRLEALAESGQDSAMSLNAELDRRSIDAGKELADQLVGLRRATFVLLALAVAVASTVAVSLVRLIGRPLRALHAAIARVEAGDLGIRLAPSGPLEVRDLSRRYNEMAAAIEQGNERIARSERLAVMGELAAGVAHEINNPLGVIKGYVSILEGSTADENVRRDLAIIADEAEQCRRIVSGLLALARPTAINPEPLDVGELVRECVERAARTTELGTRIENLPSDRVVEANIDRSAIRQVVGNLLANAIDAAGRNGTVRMDVEESASELRIVVEDSGPGLSDDVRGRLFRAFVTTKARGTGLGLAISDAIVRSHGGRIEAESAAGGGARFVVIIPRVSPSTLPIARRE